MYQILTTLERKGYFHYDNTHILVDELTKGSPSEEEEDSSCFIDSVFFQTDYDCTDGSLLSDLKFPRLSRR